MIDQRLLPRSVAPRGRVVAAVITAVCAACCGLVFVGITGFSGPVQAGLLALGLCAGWLRSGFAVFSWVILGIVCRAWVVAANREEVPFAIDLLATAAIVGVIAFSFRFLELHPRRFRWSRPQDTTLNRQGQMRTADVQLRPLAGNWFRVITALALALLILWAIPLYSEIPQQLGLSAEAVRAIIILWALAVAALLLGTILSEIAWRRLTPRQARVFLRSIFATEVRGEMKLIERAGARRKARRRTGDL